MGEALAAQLQLLQLRCYLVPEALAQGAPHSTACRARWSGPQSCYSRLKLGSSRGQCRHQGTLKPISFLFTNVALKKMTSSKASRSVGRCTNRSPITL